MPKTLRVLIDYETEVSQFHDLNSRAPPQQTYQPQLRNPTPPPQRFPAPHRMDTPLVKDANFSGPRTQQNFSQFAGLRLQQNGAWQQKASEQMLTETQHSIPEDSGALLARTGTLPAGRGVTQLSGGGPPAGAPPGNWNEFPKSVDKLPKGKEKKAKGRGKRPKGSKKQPKGGKKQQKGRGKKGKGRGKSSDKEKAIGSGKSMQEGPEVLPAGRGVPLSGQGQEMSNNEISERQMNMLRTMISMKQELDEISSDDTTTS